MSGLSVTKLERLREKLGEDPVAFFRQYRRGVKLTTTNGHKATLTTIKVSKDRSHAASRMHFRVETDEEALTFVNPYNALAYVKFLDEQNKDARLREGIHIFSTMLG